MLAGMIREIEESGDSLNTSFKMDTSFKIFVSFTRPHNPMALIHTVRK